MFAGSPQNITPAGFAPYLICPSSPNFPDRLSGVVADTCRRGCDAGRRPLG